MRLWIVAALVACKGNDAPKPTPVAKPAGDASVANCEQLPFEASTPVPEASGAAFMRIDGKDVLVVAGDSGNHGAYGLIDADSGKTIEQGLLPLNGSTDDIEGLATRGDHLFAVTSPGWILEYQRGAHGFELVAGPTALGPIDLPPKGGVGDKPPVGNGMVCDGTRTNCGRNYEGLCLSPTRGYVASKADGHLYKVSGEPLAVDRTDSIAVADPGHLADCAFDGETLYVGNNLFGLSRVSRVVDGKLQPIASIGMGFPEVLAVRGDVFYRMSDTGGAPSLMSKFRCSASAR